jgi:hypothetical protein
MKWMDHFLSAGSLAGKIICPNRKCGAKLGNYDWAGVCCGCKMWVTPVSERSLSLPRFLCASAPFAFIRPCFLIFLFSFVELKMGTD